MSDAFAVIGVTMEDLYSSEGDLFIAGMAAGVSKAAVLSFARYHPRIRMHFQNWYDYGYVAQSAEYSYFEEGKPRPKNVSTHAPEVLDKESQANYLRRAGKLVVHELGHVYGIDHCVHYHCVMNGTGHLVEDFSAPAHLCGVCLRKVQFRMGFEVVARYERLKDVFQRGVLQKEARWVERRLEHLRNR
jgi:archaemetzincin